jgi:hypothetical protein
MRYKNAIIVLGVLIAVTLSPFIGIPRSWKEGLAIFLGLLISTLAYVGTRAKAPSISLTTSFAPTPVSSEAVKSQSGVSTDSEISSNPQ